jgi:ABC-2 type transport system ATP-binding protein
VGEPPIVLAADRVTKVYRIPEPPHHRRWRVPLKRPYRELRVLDDVSFSIREGEVFGVIGRNGAGKSTLLKLLAKIYEPDEGEVFVRDDSISLADMGAGFNGSLSVRENVIMKGLLLGLRRETIKSRLDNIIDFTELHGFEDIELRKLSSGMRARLAFRMMTEMDPDIVLLDEAFSGGDAAFKAKAGHLLELFHEQGKTIVMVTHSMGQIERECDRAIWLDQGRIEAEGDPAEVVAGYKEALGIEAEDVPALDDEIDPETMRANIANLRVIDPGRQRPDEPIALEAKVEIMRNIREPQLRLEVRAEDGSGILTPALIPLTDGDAGPLRGGEKARLRLEIERALAAGTYTLNCGLLNTTKTGRNRPVSAPTSVEFSVAEGGKPLPSNGLGHSVRLELESRRKAGAR